MVVNTKIESLYWKVYKCGSKVKRNIIDQFENEIICSINILIN